MSRLTRYGLAVLVVALLVGSAFIQRPLDYMRYNKSSNSGLVPPEILNPQKRQESDLVLNMSLQFIGAAAMGMREAVASLLWVRADEFFHGGEYDAIIPLVRLVTWLDPQQIDVYSTGAWHLDYNFVDSQERSDRRYIPPAIALMKEGIRNNPEIYDLYFDLGWMHYLQKLKDYNNASYWMYEATLHDAKDMNTGNVEPRPGFVDRMLAHAYEKQGLIRVPSKIVDRDKSGRPIIPNETYLDKAEIQWQKSLKIAMNELKDPKNPMGYQEADVCRKNLGMLQLRRAWRYGDLAAYKRGIETLEGLKIPDPQQQIALAAAKKDYAKWAAAGSMPKDIYPKVDVNFTATWKKVKPKVILIEGSLGLCPASAYKGLVSESYTNWYAQNQNTPAERRQKWQSGCRVKILLEDADYDYWKIKDEKNFSWEVDKTRTVMVDDVMVRDGKFRTKIDMSNGEDSDMYPFTRKKYRLILWFNPQDAPDYIQDRIGWLGEGMTDKKYLDSKSIPGVNILYKEFQIDKNELL